MAVKVYTMSDLQELQRLHLFREIKLHARLSHPSLIAFYAAFMVRHAHQAHAGPPGARLLLAVGAGRGAGLRAGRGP